ncbi:MAG TPA: hypothetical protein ENK57_06425 [Polyangiaceae bacterium]|nr:hypothetical protein [Polyangiaceae bacterium]
MTRLRDIDPTTVADATQDALAGRLWRLAQLCGVTDPVAPSTTRSEAWLAVHQLAVYATTGTPPEHRLELVGEYCLSVSEIATWLGEQTQLLDPATDLDVVLAGALAREELDHGRPVSTAQLAVLASLSREHLSTLQSAGDAPTGRRAEGVRGMPRRIDAEEARAWLAARGLRLAAPREKNRR